MKETVVQIMLGQGRGGLEQVALDYHSVLKDNYKSFIFGRPHDDYSSKIESDALISFRSHGQYDFWNHFKINRMMNKLKPKAIFLHGNRAINLAPYVKAQKIIAVLHNPRYRVNAIKYCHRAVRVSNGFASSVYTPPLETIHNAIDLPKFNPQTRKNPLVIGTLCRLHPRKGVDILVEALKNVNFPFKLIIGGEGDEKLALQAQSKGMDVEFIGWVKNREEFFASIDCLLVPSRTEAFGLTVIEAFGAGIPVIASNTEGPSELIQHGSNGFIFEKENIEDLRRILNEFAAKTNHSQLINTARLDVEANYSYPALQQKLIRFIES